MKKTSFSRRRFLGLTAFSPLAVMVPWNVSPAEEAKDAPVFLRAKPVWAADREEEMNVSLVFSADIDVDDPAGVILRVTGSTIMRVRVNNEFAGYGPARGPHGWFRIDEWNIAPKLRKGHNTVQIEISGYNSNSFYLLDQPSFLQAEIADGQGIILAATGVENGGEIPLFSVIIHRFCGVFKAHRSR